MESQPPLIQEPIQTNVKPKKPRKADDKRTLTSRLNAQKAREAKLAKKKAEEIVSPKVKTLEQIVEDDESDDEVIYFTNKPNVKETPQTKDSIDPNDFEEMKNMLKELRELKKTKQETIPVVTETKPIDVPKPSIKKEYLNEIRKDILSFRNC